MFGHRAKNNTEPKGHQKSTIKAFHYAIFNLVLKLESSAPAYVGWSGYKPSYQSFHLQMSQLHNTIVI